MGDQGTKQTIRALCDNGSQVNLISNNISQKLGLKPNSNRTTFIGIGGTKLGSASGETRVSIQLNNGTLITDTFFIVKNITNYTPQSDNHTTNWNKLISKNHFADDKYDQPGVINALLGVGIWIQIIEPGIIRNRNNNAVAHQTKLGYVIFENRDDPYQIEEPYIGAISKGPSIKKLSELMQKLWEIEELPQQKVRTKEEEKCEEVFVQGHSRDKTGRYIVRIPFNDKINHLGKSKKMALHQFFAMEGRMRRNPEFAAKYRIFMTEYEVLGHMTQIRDREEEGYYTPHHGVLSSSKFRVVFNASAKTTSGISLNEAQLVGEKLQPDLFIVLVSFRQYRFGITADIEKMYRQILVHPEDRKYQKIIWRENEKEPIKVYQLNTITYGHTCAPHCAIRTLVQCTKDYEIQYPRGASIVRECFYVDDLLTGAHTIQDVKAIKTEVTSLLAQGKMNITKWKTNGQITEKIELGKEKEDEGQRVLGLCWDLSNDKLFYKIHEEAVNKEFIWTKRRILSKIGKLYDPNGFLGPIIMTGKIIIQDLWRDKLDWDEQITGDIQKKWKTFNEDLKNIRDITINRWLGTTEAIEMQLHGFCDASEKGYGAVIYSRVRERETYRMEIIASKSRVAPLKMTTIPRLELCAASLLANLMKIVIPAFKIKQIRVFAWTDSQIVLQWITNPSPL